MRKGYYRFPIDVDFQTRPTFWAVLPTAHIRFETDLSSFPLVTPPPGFIPSWEDLFFPTFFLSFHFSPYLPTDNRGPMKIRVQSEAKRLRHRYVAAWISLNRYPRHVAMA